MPSGTVRIDQHDQTPDWKEHKLHFFRLFNRLEDGAAGQDGPARR